MGVALDRSEVEGQVHQGADVAGVGLDGVAAGMVGIVAQDEGPGLGELHRDDPE